MKYGDAVSLLRKQPDGTIQVLNAIVLSSDFTLPRTLDRRLIEHAEAEEYLDLAFPVYSENPPKSRNFEEIFRPAYRVGQWRGDGIGWKPLVQALYRHPSTACAVCEAQGSGTERYNEARGDYSQPGDPYGIAKEYTAQSPVDVRGNSQGTLRELPTQAEADAIVAQGAVERAEKVEAEQSAGTMDMGKEKKYRHPIQTDADLDAAAEEQAPKG